MKYCTSANFFNCFFKQSLLIIFVFNTSSLNAQQSRIDSLKNLISNTKNETDKIELYSKLGEAYYLEKKMDSSVLSFQRSIEINQKNEYSLLLLCWNTAALDYRLYEMGNYLESLQYAVQHLALSKQLNDTSQQAMAHLVFAHNYKYLGYYNDALAHYFKAKELFSSKGMNNVFTYECIGDVYVRSGKLDSALVYAQLAYDSAVAISAGGFILYALRVLGDIYFKKGDDVKALEYYRQYIPGYVTYKESNRDLGFVLNGVSRIFQKRRQMDSAILYAKKALANAETYDDQENLFNAADLLASFYKGKDYKTAYNYLAIATAAKDSMASSDKSRQAQIIEYNEQVREKEKAAADEKEAARKRLIIIVAALVISIISFLIWSRL
jgi:tetratricopeptide (TPR) repeat protein